MKNTILFFFLLLAAAVSAQSNSFVTDRLRAAEYLRIGTNTSQKVTGFDRVITAPGTHDSLPTSRAVVDFLEANFTPIGYYTAGTGISISDDVITNAAPDQVVGLTGGGITVITGTYPNFTITSNEVDGSTTNELQNLSLSGQSLSISSGTGVTLPVVGVSAGTGIGVSGSSGTFTVSNTGDLSATNELNTSFSVSGSNLALTDAGGTINVAVSSIAPVQAVSAGTGISISGTTTRTVTNTGDLSATNEIQTLSLSGSDLSLSLGGGTVTLPRGAVSWPLLAPDGGEADGQYSFQSLPGSGMYYDGSGIHLHTPDQFGTDGKGVFIKSSASNTAGGGNVSLQCGNGSGGSGGSVVAAAGNSESASGGIIQVSSGASTDGAGGQVSITAGNSVNADGGYFSMSAGTSDTQTGGYFVMNAGNGAAGGYFAMNAGNSTSEFGAGGNATITAGSSISGDAGRVVISSGASDGSGGDIEITTGTGGVFNGKVIITAGSTGSMATSGFVQIIGAALMLANLTESQRDAITSPQAGFTVYCTDATADDSSTGVLQVYNGTTWKNCW